MRSYKQVESATAWTKPHFMKIKFNFVSHSTGWTYDWCFHSRAVCLLDDYQFRQFSHVHFLFTLYSLLLSSVFCVLCFKLCVFYILLLHRRVYFVLFWDVEMVGWCDVMWWCHSHSFFLILSLSLFSSHSFNIPSCSSIKPPKLLSLQSLYTYFFSLLAGHGWESFHHQNQFDSEKFIQYLNLIKSRISST